MWAIIFMLNLNKTVFIENIILVSSDCVFIQLRNQGFLSLRNFDDLTTISCINHGAIKLDTKSYDTCLEVQG